MTKAEDYRRHAAQLLAMAERAMTPAHRAEFQKMAERWLQRAEEAEREMRTGRGRTDG